METQEIFLESGINEMELLTFLVGEQIFGVNVAKVESVVQFDPSRVTKKSGAASYIRGPSMKATGKLIRLPY